MSSGVVFNGTLHRKRGLPRRTAELSGSDRLPGSPEGQRRRCRAQRPPNGRSYAPRSLPAHSPAPQPSFPPTSINVSRGCPKCCKSWTRGWLGDPTFALYAVMVASVWATVGPAFVIFTAALHNVDTDLLDAARMDGANGWQRFRHVVIPQLSNAITLVTVLLRR
ncbi:sugar ABC transporter permease [Nonomuraea sp. NEAU-L178]|nr:sugar ABC transporter permease [Nonomuraea aurantiaca]